MSRNAWTEEEDFYLRELWPTENHSAEIIGGIIGRSRNAVIGRAQRLGLSKKGPPRGRRKRVLVPRVERADFLPSKSVRRIAP